MAIPHHHANAHLEQLLRERSVAELGECLASRPEQTPVARLPRDHRISEKMVARRWQLLPNCENARRELLDAATQARMTLYERNIENFIGTATLPVGLAGPLRVNGLFAREDYWVPLATTEAALVASYSRGAQTITRAGGCATLVLSEGVSRAPGFAFDDLRQAGGFVAWVVTQQEQFKLAAAKTTAHGKLIDMQVTVEGNHVYLRFEFRTGDAAGQNMVTLATQAICEYIEAHSPIQPNYFFLEANLSGDKKASAQSFLSVRGKKVTAEITLPGDLVKQALHTSAQRMVDYWRMSALGGVMSGTLGVQGHYANGLAALFIACGQDAACVAESSVGVTRFELSGERDLYATVTLPNLIVGTVGGGTGLPSQQACLEILGLAGANNARAFAEVCAGLILAGEISIIAALCSGHFARAHQQLARR